MIAYLVMPSGGISSCRHSPLEQCRLPERESFVNPQLRMKMAGTLQKKDERHWKNGVSIRELGLPLQDGETAGPPRDASAVAIGFPVAAEVQSWSVMRFRT